MTCPTRNEGWFDLLREGAQTYSVNVLCMRRKAPADVFCTAVEHNGTVLKYSSPCKGKSMQEIVFKTCTGSVITFAVMTRSKMLLLH